MMSNSVGIYVSHMNYIADIGVDYGAVAANFEGLGVFSLSIKSLSVGQAARFMAPAGPTSSFIKTLRPT